jgi:hypothetical protein
MSSVLTLYHTSYQLSERVLVQTQLSIVQFQESTNCEQCSLKKGLSVQNLQLCLTDLLEDMRLCAIKRKSVCYTCCV